MEAEEGEEARIWPPEAESSEAERARLRGFERALREAVRKGVEAGWGTLSRTDRVLRAVVDDVKLPKEAVSLLLSQLDETKRGLFGAVAREVRDFLEHTDLASELQRVLTALSFEIRTEIRFVPNRQGQGLRPSVRAAARPRRSSVPEPPPGPADETATSDPEP
ncbi:MAG: hypothetical protein ACPGUV_06125 [Polyangiales bacterium]